MGKGASLTTCLGYGSLVDSRTISLLSSGTKANSKEAGGKEVGSRGVGSREAGANVLIGGI